MQALDNQCNRSWVDHESLINMIFAKIGGVVHSIQRDLREGVLRVPVHGIDVMSHWCVICCVPTSL